MGDLEYERIENKKLLAERHDAMVAIAAFATTVGVVRVGVRPDGRRVGVQLGRTLLEEFANQNRMGTDAPQYPRLKRK